MNITFKISENRTNWKSLLLVRTHKSVKEKKKKANKKLSDDSKNLKRLEKLINPYQQRLFTGKIGKLKDTKIKRDIIIYVVRWWEKYLSKPSLIKHLFMT